MAKSKRKKHAARLRHKASFELDLLIERGGGKCYWCGCDIVRYKNIRNRIIKKGSHQVTYRDEGGEVKIARIATVEHIRNIRDGGGNRANLAAACAKCNQLRGKADLEGVPFVPAGAIQQSPDTEKPRA